MTHMLLVDDEAQFRTTLIRALKSQGHRVTAIGDCDTLAISLSMHRPDMVLLDLMFESGLSGLDVCRRLRSWSSVPVIVVSAHNDERIKVQALDAGADDFIAKPFGIDELLARVRAVQRRLTPNSAAGTSLIRVNDLVIDLDGHMAWLSGELLHLTPKEYELLRVLGLALGRLVTNEKILQEVWGGDTNAERVSVRTLVKQLRDKLGEDLNKPGYILTEAGIGYRLNINSLTEAQ